MKVIVETVCHRKTSTMRLNLVSAAAMFVAALCILMNARATFSIVPDPPPSDCSDLYDNGHNESGVYTVYIHVAGHSVGVDVYCDMTTDGGRWMVFQRRENGTVDFYRDWESYRKGFGELNGEHWLGNDMIHLFTDAKHQELRVDISDITGDTFYAQYKSFYVSSNATQFRLNVSGYNGTAGDALKSHNGFCFSTYDQDNDILATLSCAVICHGAWWYFACYDSNLNGPYNLQGRHMKWFGWYWTQISILKQTEMKMRPLKP